MTIRRRLRTLILGFRRTKTPKSKLDTLGEKVLEEVLRRGDDVFTVDNVSPNSILEEIAEDIERKHPELKDLDRQPLSEEVYCTIRKELPKHQRQILQLSLDGLSYNQIAAQHNLDPKLVLGELTDAYHRVSRIVKRSRQRPAAIVR